MCGVYYISSGKYWKSSLARSCD